MIFNDDPPQISFSKNRASSLAVIANVTQWKKLCVSNHCWFTVLSDKGNFTVRQEMFKDCLNKWTAKTSCLYGFRFLQFSLNSKIIKSSNAPLVIGKVAENSHVGRQIAWDFILKHWNILEKRLSILWPLELFSVFFVLVIWFLCCVWSITWKFATFKSLHLKYITASLIYQLSRWSKLVTVRRFLSSKQIWKFPPYNDWSTAGTSFGRPIIMLQGNSSFVAIAFHLQGR